ncbi:MAG: 3'-5' exonuclease domain-containing protein 2 [Rikenellaceae bacterium]|nr:3'-5' exonuclease domain-containing protein 2 [Rikenellaceae bacterium]
MVEYRATITNEEVNDLPLTAFGGDIVVVDSADQREAAAYLSSQKLIGFDTESRATFVKGAHNTISLVQLSGPDRAYLFRVNICPLSPEIIRVLQSRAIIKVGLAIKDDIANMRTVNPLLYPHGFVDLQSIVGRFGIKELGLKKISAIVLGRRISKAQRLSNWNAVNLTEAQRVYAATDAWVCREIYRSLMTAEKEGYTTLSADAPDVVKPAEESVRTEARGRRRFRRGREKKSLE